MAGQRTDDSDPRHSIGVVADRTGLSVHQLRAWERRHGVVRPERTEGGHRLYSDGDLRRLTILADLTSRGRRIGQLAELATEELASLLERDREEGEEQEPAAGAGAAANGALEEVRGEALEAIEGFEAGRLETLVRRASLRHGLRTFVEGLVVPVLHEVGSRWHTGELGVAQEHLASSVFVRALETMLDAAGPEPGTPAIVVATPDGYRHEIGAMIAAALAGSEGWRVFYLGAEVPATELARTAREVGARAVAVSLVYADSEDARAEVGRLREELPASVELLVGGRAASDAEGLAAPGVPDVEAAVRILPDFDDFTRRLGELGGSRRRRGRAGADDR